MVRKLLVYTSVFCICVTTVSAHSGKTNANGCHTNSKTNEYHCHTPIKNTANVKNSTNSNDRTLKPAASNVSAKSTSSKPAIQFNKNIYTQFV